MATLLYIIIEGDEMLLETNVSVFNVGCHVMQEPIDITSPGPYLAHTLTNILLFIELG